MNSDAKLIQERLVEAGGRMSQDLGLGRISGQVLVFLYLSCDDRSLDEIEDYLDLSKASVSIAARQLERLGMIVRVWKGGDRKSYYRTADNFNQALQKGIVEYTAQKLSLIGDEIEYAGTMLESVSADQNQDTQFLIKRVKRAAVLKGRVGQIINNPLVNTNLVNRDITPSDVCVCVTLSYHIVVFR